MSNENIDRGALLDNLYLEMFDLIEQQVRCKVDIEKHNNSGQLLLAKTRYIQGTQSIGLAQIPTELSNDFNALCRVNEVPSENTLSGTELSLHKNPIDTDNGFMDPLKWFGALPPSSLRMACEQFKKSVELVVESANLNLQLKSIINSILKLKSYFEELPR